MTIEYNRRVNYTKLFRRFEMIGFEFTEEQLEAGVHEDMLKGYASKLQELAEHPFDDDGTWLIEAAKTWKDMLSWYCKLPEKYQHGF